MSLALIFPGQGSQHVGMCGALAAAEPKAAEVLATANRVLGFDLARLMREGPEGELTETKNAQPAILVHSVAALEVARDRVGPVAIAAGHSLGEFSAHVAAGTLSFEDALAAVRLRGELMFAAGLERPGAMAVVLGLGEAEIEVVCARVDAGTCHPANFNSEGQIVISGDTAGVEQGMRLLKEAGAKKVIPLKVSGAFHSALMEPAAGPLRRRLEAIEFRNPTFPVVSNVTARPVTTGGEARELLVRQLTSPVRWSASVAAMVGAGADRFLELGPGKVLATLNRRNAPAATSTPLGEPSDFEALAGS
ncbi:MAG: [acyl-carrier-protein] S-malonyltransferase [Gemmatimonadetes bacterium]|nr:[acyl-carrier-protein] S-malonyltransferase [Gemmatimonadota bacterium]